MEMAMKLLEKDVHHKQDTIVCLRDQLEDIKDINLEMYTKLQVHIVALCRHVLASIIPRTVPWTILDQI